MNNAKELFELAAETGEWPSKYHSINFANYNFIARRKSVESILNGDLFPSVLDLGCGTGDYFEVLANVSEMYVGVDFSQSMIKQARLRYADSPANPQFREGSAEALPFDDNSFDLVCAIGFIEYFDNPAIPMREIVCVLKPGGVLVMQSFQVDLFKKISRVAGLDIAKRIVKYMYGMLRKSLPSGFGIDRPYSKKELDRLVESFNFVKNSSLYNNFNIFPKTIRRLFPKLYINFSEKITATSFHDTPERIWFQVCHKSFRKGLEY